MLTYDLLKTALVEGVAELAHEQHRDIVFAAPLALRVMKRLKVLLGPGGCARLARQLGVEESAMKLTGDLYGPLLYPDEPFEGLGKLKFRQFLAAFPDVVQVVGRPSGGDVVRLLQRTSPDRGDLSRAYRSLLMDTLLWLTEKHPDADAIPSNQLAIWMKKRNPAFNVNHLGYSSLTEWLQNVPEVKVESSDGQVRVRLAPEAARPRPVPGTRGTERRPAYLLVDSSDLHSTLHEILGAKPTQSQLPDWSKIFQYCRDRWPDCDWRGRYLLARADAEHEALKGLIGYLEAVGFKFIPLDLREAGTSFEETRRARAATTFRGLQKGIELIVNEGRAAVLAIVCHNAAFAESLSKTIGRARDGVQVALMGFPEKSRLSWHSCETKGSLSSTWSVIAVRSSIRSIALLGSTQRASVPRIFY